MGTYKSLPQEPQARRRGLSQPPKVGLGSLLQFTPFKTTLPLRLMRECLCLQLLVARPDLAQVLVAVGCLFDNSLLKW